MELLYQVEKTVPKSLKTSSNSRFTDFFKYNNERSISSISSSNIIAYSSLFQLNDATGECMSWHLYVSDLSSPWISYKILSSIVPLTVLEWNTNGDLLLIGNRDGFVQILKSTEYLLNEWKSVFSIKLSGESILCGIFLNPESCFSLNFDSNKDNYLEKFQNPAPACNFFRQFGNQPVQGCVFLTTTGILCTIIFLNNLHSETRVKKTCLAAFRMPLASASMCFQKSGDLHIAVNNGRSDSPVQVYKVRICNDENDENFCDNVQINIGRLNSFYLSDTSTQINCLQWLNKDDPNNLLIVQDSKVQIWQLCEQPFPVSSLFGSKESFIETKWILKQETEVFSKKKMLLISDQYIFIDQFEDNIECLSKNDLQVLATFPFKNTSPRWGMASMAITLFNFLLVIIDDFGQISVLKLNFKSLEEILSKTNNIVSLLEYCLITGCDWFEIVPHLSPNVISEQVIDKFVDNFNRQPNVNQQYYFLSYLAMLSCLYRCNGHYQKANDLNSLVMLHSISTAFKVLLRPSELSSHEQSPADSLANVMKTEVHSDVDKVLCYLEAKDFTVEPSTLQSLQHLIQWVADVALNLLAKLPDQKLTCCSYLVKESLPILRELLVIIRIWGLLRRSCLPVFVKSVDNLDVLSLLFRLLSKLAQNPDLIDDNLLDECFILQSPIFIPNLPQVSSESLFTSLQLNYPLIFKNDVEPEFVSNSITSNRSRYSDCIRHTSMGMPPLLAKQCLRCGFITGTHQNSRSAATRAWELRWQKSCICRGLWRLKFLNY